MTYTLVVILSASIAFPAIIGAIRYSTINPVYYPFLYCIWLGFLNEIIGYFVVRSGNSNAFNNNLYTLAEAILFTWLFKRWGVFNRSRHTFLLLVAVYCVAWLTETFLLDRMKHNTSYFRVLYAFVIVLLSIQTIYTQLILEKRNILKNSVFLICAGFVIYYTYNVIVGLFWLYGLNASLEFQMSIINIMIFINCFVNLIYALAVLWMPTKHRFSLPS